MKKEIQENLVNLLNCLIVSKGMTEKDSKNFVMKHFDLPELGNVEPTGIISKKPCNAFAFTLFKSSDGKFFKDIQNVNISNKQCVNVAMTFLVYNLLNNHNLYQFDSQITCIKFIFDKFADTEFHNQYDEIIKSEFMKEMRKQYMENNELKDDLTYSKVMEKMLSLKTQDEFTLEQITTWNKFCDFFAQIVKLIYKMLGQGEYKSTLDEKNVRNESIKTQNAEIQQHNEKVGAWVKLATECKSEVEKGIGIN